MLPPIFTPAQETFVLIFGGVAIFILVCLLAGILVALDRALKQMCNAFVKLIFGSWRK